MARAGWLLATLSSLTLLLASLPATGLPLETPELQEAPTYDEAWAASFQDAMAWGSENSHLTANGLILAAGTQGWTDDALERYEESSHWAEITLNQRVTANGLQERLTTLLASAGASEGGWIVQLDQVSTELYPALNVLLQAQNGVAANGQAYPSIDTDPLGHTRAMLFDGLHLAAAIDVVVPHLAGLPDDVWPEEPVFVDPVGLVIIGGTGDDEYNGGIDPVAWQGPTLLIEPRGSDTYNIPIASTQTFTLDQPGWRAGLASLAIELHGNDTYNQHVASARQGQNALHLLHERNGNDSYADTTITRAVASTWPGTLTALHDKNGNDTYYTKDRGLAYAQLGTAVLTDRAGNDHYEANTDGVTAGFTHAAGENFGAIAVLRDYAGDDTFIANGLSFASSEDDANTLFIDDEGNDHKYIDVVGLTSLGRKYISEGGLINAPTRKSLAYYLDGSGEDTFSWRVLGSLADPDFQEQNHTFFRNGSQHSYSIFIDCTTPPGADYPCPEENDNATAFILEKETKALP